MQGGSLGILEYLSQTSHSLSFLEHDEGYRYVDDNSIVEIVNLLSAGLASFNSRSQVPNDMATNDSFLPTHNFKMQQHLNQLNEWTEKQEMLLNKSKTRYSIVNFCTSMQFQTRLLIKNSL